MHDEPFQGKTKKKWIVTKKDPHKDLSSRVFITPFTTFPPFSYYLFRNLSHNQLVIGADNVFPHLESLHDLYKNPHSQFLCVCTSILIFRACLTCRFLVENRIGAVYKDTVSALPNLMLL